MLEHLIKEWLAQDLTLSQHFNVFIDEDANKKMVPNWAVIRSTINIACRHAPKRSSGEFSRLHRFQRYYHYEEPIRRPIAFINSDHVELSYGHRIGLKKNLEIMSSDPEFFMRLTNVMCLMHKVEFGKTCELKPSDL